jgi:hypothetical protein
LFEYTREGTGKGGVADWEGYPFYEPIVDVLEIWKKVGATKDRGQVVKWEREGVTVTILMTRRSLAIIPPDICSVLWSNQ